MRASYLLSAEHLHQILREDQLLFSFNSFLLSYRPADVAVLQYYLTALQIQELIESANTLIGTLPSLHGFGLDHSAVSGITNPTLDTKMHQAFTILHRESLPAYVAYSYHISNAARHQRVVAALATGGSAPQSDSLAQMFCVTDPSQPGNPILFASKEFCRNTQYPMQAILNRSTSFLQGPNTDVGAFQRLAAATAAEKAHSEVIVNYRRDGSPFLNLHTITPLRDARGRLRYWLQGSVDCSHLATKKDDSAAWPLRIDSARPTNAETMPSLPQPASSNRLRKVASLYSIYTEQSLKDQADVPPLPKKPSSDMLTPLSDAARSDSIVTDDTTPTSATTATSIQKFFADDAADLQAPSPLTQTRPGFADAFSMAPPSLDARSPGIYHRYLLIRPSEPFRILFASPALQLPHMIQSPFMGHVGGDRRVRDHLAAALRGGRKVTAKISWLNVATSAVEDVEPPTPAVTTTTSALAASIKPTKPSGRLCWAHCTPLFGDQGAVGVWMILLLDEPPASPSAYTVPPPLGGAYELE